MTKLELKDLIPKLIKEKKIYRFYNLAVWQRKRAEALKRDNFECQNCKNVGKLRMADCVHHVVEVQSRAELALELENLRSLCNRCHNAVHERNFKKSDGFHAPERW